MRKKIIRWLCVVGIILGLLVAVSVYGKVKFTEKGSLEDFYKTAEEGNLRTLHIIELTGQLDYYKEGNESVAHKVKVSRYFYEGNKDLLDKLTEEGVNVVFKEKMNLGGLGSSLFTLVFLAFMIYILYNLVGGFGKVDLDYIESENTKFKDMAGYDNVKSELKDLIEYLKNPEKVKKYTDNIPRGILFEGDPGNGKTLLGRVIAGESETPFFYISGSDIEGKFVSQGSSKVGEIFKKVRETISKEGKAILFIDELDTVGMDRTKRTVTETNQTINKLLTELDGFKKSDNLLVIGATNLVEHLDKALVRPGRFDRVIKINMPTRKDRVEILNLYLSKKDESIVEEEIYEENYIDTLSRMTVGFSGSGLARLVNDASLLAYQKESKIDIGILRESYLRVVMGLPNDMLIREEDMEIVANHEAAHAVISMVTSRLGYRSVAYGTIKSYGNAMGHIAMVDEGSPFWRKSDFYNKIYVLLAGRAIEDRLLSGDFTSGASNDLMKVNQLLTKYLVESGMSEDNENIYVDPEWGNLKAEWLYEETKKIREKLYEETLDLVDKYWGEIEELSSFLLDKKEVNQHELKEMFGKKFPDKEQS